MYTLWGAVFGEFIFREGGVHVGNSHVHASLAIYRFRLGRSKEELISPLISRCLANYIYWLKVAYRWTAIFKLIVLKCEIDIHVLLAGIFVQPKHSDLGRARYLGIPLITQPLHLFKRCLRRLSPYALTMDFPPRRSSTNPDQNSRNTLLSSSFSAATSVIFDVAVVAAFVT